MELSDLRQEINNIDDQLIALFSARMRICAQVAQIKKEQNLPIHVPEREQEILRTVSAKSDSGLGGYAMALYAVLLELSRNYQEELIADKE